MIPMSDSSMSSNKDTSKSKYVTGDTTNKIGLNTMTGTLQMYSIESLEAIQNENLCMQQYYHPSDDASKDNMLMYP